MFDWLRRERDVGRKAGEIYGAVVAQAREPAFYLDFGVPDTHVGRYEMIALHLSLVLDRMGAPGVGDEELRRGIVERFVTDMDDAMREMGIGDTSVPRNVKKAAGGLLERTKAYRAALAAQSETGASIDQLPETLARYVYAKAGSPLPASLSALAAYVRDLDRHLAALPDDGFRAASVSFPIPGGATAPVIREAER